MKQVSVKQEWWKVLRQSLAEQEWWVNKPLRSRSGGKANPCEARAARVVGKQIFVKQEWWGEKCVKQTLVK